MITVNDSIKNAYNNYTTQRKPYIVVGNNTYYIQNMEILKHIMNIHLIQLHGNDVEKPDISSYQNID